jgi:hypothetical protein
MHTDKKHIQEEGIFKDRSIRASSSSSSSPPPLATDVDADQHAMLVLLVVRQAKFRKL